VDDKILHEVRQLYRESQAKFKESDSQRESDSEYWRGKIDAFYDILSLLQSPDDGVC
jgi:hypothetical protein